MINFVSHARVFDGDVDESSYILNTTSLKRIERPMLDLNSTVLSHSPLTITTLYQSSSGDNETRTSKSHVEGVDTCLWERDVYRSQCLSLHRGLDVDSNSVRTRDYGSDERRFSRFLESQIGMCEYCSSGGVYEEESDTSDMLWWFLGDETSEMDMRMSVGMGEWDG
ncbi:hypothetical protein Tco_0291293 [Tanacetum coccineum]